MPLMTVRRLHDFNCEASCSDFEEFADDIKFSGRVNLIEASFQRKKANRTMGDAFHSGAEKLDENKARR
jgi:hypothetical protein